MRITAKAKEATRARILSTARRLFDERGFEATSTRDLAAAAGIAAGTLFNYFPTKEGLAMTLFGEALERGEARFRSRRRGGESLEEDLFLHIASGMRELEPYRSYLGEVMESAMSPFGRSAVSAQGEELRIRHLEAVAELLREHCGEEAATSRPAEARHGFVSIHLYWTLYLGVLAFWARDESPNQEDTLVVLYQSLRLYVASIDRDDPSQETPDGSENR